MYYGQGTIRSCEEFLYYRISTQRGQSGSPIFKREKGNQYVIGVHIGVARETSNFAIRLTPEKRKRINEWMGEITSELNLGKLGFILDRQNLGDGAMKEVAERWSAKLTSLQLGKS